MEKVIYALWRNKDTARDQFNKHLLETARSSLADNALAVRVNLQDAAVANGTSPRSVSTTPQMEAVVQVWIDSANDGLRAPTDNIIAETCSRFEAFLVSESAPLKNTLYPPKPGARTDGFSQIVFLRRPKDLSWAKWRYIWQNQHTQVAIETQSNFEYRQNLITRRLTPESGLYDAIIEECFPIEALTDALDYFDAPNDPEKMQVNLRRMMESVAKFIDHNRMDCIPTSQFDIKALPDI